MKKINSEKSISDDLFKLKIGTTDKKGMSVVYIEGSCYLVPNFFRENYSQDVREMISILTKEITSIIKARAIRKDANYVSNFEIAEDHISQKKKSCFSFQIFFQPKDFRPYEERNNGFKEYSSTVSTILQGFIPKFKEIISQCGFSIYKTKN